MTATVISTARAELVDIITAAINDPAVKVSYGHPGPVTGVVDVVAVRDAYSDIEWAALGARRKNETLGVDVVVSCRRGGTDQQTVTERAFALLDLIDTGIRNPSGDITIGGAVSWGSFTQVTLTESNPQIYDMTKGRVAELFCTLTGTARI